VSIAGGLAGAAVTDGNPPWRLGANTARVEVENNSLSPGHDEEELEKEHGDRLQKFIMLPGLECCLTKMASRFLELLVLELGLFRLGQVVLLKVNQPPRFHLSYNRLPTPLKDLSFLMGG
jgi:filamentous hemagglutinin